MTWIFDENKKLKAENALLKTDLENYKSRYYNAIHQQTDNLTAYFNKLTSLLDNYDNISSHTEFFKNNYCLPIVANGLIQCYQNYINMSSVISGIIDELTVEDKNKLLVELKPILIKYIKNENKLQDLEYCNNTFKIINKPLFKKKGLK